MGKQFLRILEGYKIVTIDTDIFIYYIEENPTYTPIVQLVFERITAGRLQVIISVITLIETLTQPLRKGRLDLVEEYRELFLSTKGITTFEIDANIGEKAAELRAKYKLRVPDAIQLAVGIVKRADAFITNDAAIRKVKEIEVLVLKDFINKGKWNKTTH